jgi:hypothetical protein
MAALKDDVDDLCSCSQRCLAGLVTLSEIISLTERGDISSTKQNQQNHPDISFNEDNDISLIWLGYRPPSADRFRPDTQAGYPQ